MSACFLITLLSAIFLGIPALPITTIIFLSGYPLLSKSSNIMTKYRKFTYILLISTSFHSYCKYFLPNIFHLAKLCKAIYLTEVKICVFNWRMHITNCIILAQDQHLICILKGPTFLYSSQLHPFKYKLKVSYQTQYSWVNDKRKNKGMSLLFMKSWMEYA